MITTILWAVIAKVAFVIILWMFYTKFFGAEYFPVSDKALSRMISFSKLGKKDTAYDLGCGDGKIILASSLICKRAIGVEIDPVRVLIAKFKTRYHKNAKILWKNMYSAKLNDANVIFMFLRQNANDKLEKRLKQLKKGTRIISHCWKLKGIKPYKADKKLEVYAYKI